jgi:transcriptional regulator with XRE-family HTH domain
MTPPEENKVYSISTLALIVFKCLRTERNMPQAYIAEHLDMKSVSSWTKIENGQSQLTLDVFYRVCEILQVRPSQVTNITDHIAFFLSRAGFYPRTIDSTKDDLMPIVRAYYGRKMTPIWNPLSGSWTNDSIMSNWPMTGELPEIIRYCTEPEYRNELS